MSAAVDLIPSGWHDCEVVGSAVIGKVLKLDLMLSTRRHFQRRVAARLDLARRAALSSILPRIVDAVGAGQVSDSRDLHHRALCIRLAVENGENVVVDARTLTRRGCR